MHDVPHPSRRRIVHQGAALGLASLGAPWLLGTAHAQADDLGPYRAARINWRQAEGETITVAVIPAGYFENLITLAPQFEALTGVKLRFEKVPPGQIRQKAMLDLSSKTATFATHAADPMYYPLYTANRWVDPLDRYLSDPALTDPAWFNYNDILKAWRDAASVDGKPYGIPYDGEVTVQVYRKDLYAAKGLKPADTLDELLANAKAVHDPAEPRVGPGAAGLCRRGAEHVHLSVAAARFRRRLDAAGGEVVVNSAAGGARRCEWYVDALAAIRAARRCATGTGRTSPTRSRRARWAATSTRTRRRR
jgi:multiple sugar transport system substrate-binding protein